MKNQLEEFIKNNRAQFEDEMPSADVLAKILAKTAPKKQTVLWMPWIQRFAATIILLSGAWFGFKFFDQQHSVEDRSVVIAPIASLPPMLESPPMIQPEFVEVVEKEAYKSNKVQNQPRNAVWIDQVPALSGNTKIVSSQNVALESTSQRFAKVHKIMASSQIDKAIIDQLFLTLETDENTNVRMAALTSISKFSAELSIKEKLTKGLAKQNDPYVKISMIELLTQLRADKINEELEKIYNDDASPRYLKDHAQMSLLKLKS